MFNDTDAEKLWFIVSAPEEPEFLHGSIIKDSHVAHPYGVNRSNCLTNSAARNGCRKFDWRDIAMNSYMLEPVGFIRSTVTARTELDSGSVLTFDTNVPQRIEI